MASPGSKAAESGNSNANRLNDDSLKKLRDTSKSNLNAETVAFLASISYDQGEKKLKIKTSDG